MMKARHLGQPVNSHQQLEAANLLLELTRTGLQASAPEADPILNAMDAGTNACRRVVALAVAGLDSPADRRVVSALIAANLGQLCGQLLRDLPDDVVQQAVENLIGNLTNAIGADPTRSASSVTISSGQETTH